MRLFFATCLAFAASSGAAHAESFAGTYAGILGGTASPEFKINAENDSFDSAGSGSGATFGALIGYDWRLGKGAFISAEASLLSSNIDTSFRFAGTNIPAKERFYFEIATRVGAVVSEKAGVYARLAVGGSHYRVEQVGNVDLSDLSTAYNNVVLGVGAQYDISPRISLRADYGHGFDLSKRQGELTLTGGGLLVPQTIDFKGSVVRDQVTAGLTIRF